jgi:hypothetical protein
MPKMPYFYKLHHTELQQLEAFMFYFTWGSNFTRSTTNKFNNKTVQIYLHDYVNMGLKQKYWRDKYSL